MNKEPVTSIEIQKIIAEEMNKFLAENRELINQRVRARLKELKKQAPKQD